jgi:hypothetical protein
MDDLPAGALAAEWPCHRATRPQMRNCASGKLEISTLRVAPE